MQEIINRNLYDTEEAELIAEHAPNTDTGDFNYLVETLYKTEDGEYFLHGRGGPRTKYVKSVNGGRSGSATLKVLTEDEALDWCESHSIDAETVINEFGHLIEH